MTSSNNNFFQTIINALISIAILVAIIFLLLNAQKRPRNVAKDFRKEISNILETVYNEGFAPIKIDYNDPVLLSRNIFLSGDLDDRAAAEVMMKLKHLESLDSSEAINLYIETSGGYGGVMLANYLQSIACPINTIALDYCCSAGCEVLAGGTGVRKAFNSSRIIVHIVKGDDSCVDDEHYSNSRLVDKVTSNFWKEHSKLTEAFYQRDSEVLFNFTAEEALAFGIIDEIMD